MLGERYEDRRRDHPARWVGPAYKGLDTSDPPVVGGDDRLVHGAHLAPLQCAAQVEFQTGLVLFEMLRGQIEDLVTGASLTFGLVHGHICVVEKPFGGVVAPIGEGDADTCPHVHLDA
jgi:hypothetical protein